MISLQRSMHSSQMYTPGPAMSFLTCFWLFPQKEHFNRSPPSPIRATGDHPPVISLQCNYPTVPRAGPFRGRTRGTRRRGSCQCWGALEGLEHGVDEAVLDRALGGQDLVALDVLADL